MMDVSGVLMSWARYTTSSFLRSSAAFAARSLRSPSALMPFRNKAVGASSLGSTTGPSRLASTSVTESSSRSK